MRTGQSESAWRLSTKTSGRRYTKLRHRSRPAARRRPPLVTRCGLCSLSLSSGPAPKRQTTTLCGSGGRAWQTSFIFGRRAVRQRRVQALPVVEDLDEVEDCLPRLRPGRPDVAVHELDLQGRVERFAHRVVPDLPRPRQTLRDPVCRQQLRNRAEVYWLPRSEWKI